MTDTPEFTGENADLNDVVAGYQNRNQKPAVGMNVEYAPENPFAMQVEAEGLGKSEPMVGIQGESTKNPGRFETVKEEFKEFNPLFKLTEYQFNKQVEALANKQPVPAGWSPKSDPNKFNNVSKENLAFCMDAKTPADLDFRIYRSLQEQHHKEVMENGSLFYKAIGGGIGFGLDPTARFAMFGALKYAKFGSAIFNNMAKAFPSMLGYSLSFNATKQLDSIHGNLVDFAKDAAVDTLFGTAIFGVLGAAGLTAEKMNLWDLRKVVSAQMDGITFKHIINEKGELSGIKAFDETGSAGAKKLDLAQQFADSSFHRGAVFKVPFLGAGIYNFLTMPILGTPLPKLLSSSLTSVAGIVDRIVDHTLITTGLAKGNVSPIKFETLMRQEFSDLRSLQVQATSLWLERNGFDISNRVGGSFVNKYLYLRNAAKHLGANIDNSNYVSREAFDQEIENVLYSEKPHEHAAVNEAAGLFRNKMDTVYKAYRDAHNLPEDWIPPRTAMGFLMRVYDTPYLNSPGVEDKWIKAISDYFEQSDAEIRNRMQPIKDLEAQIATQTEAHEKLIRSYSGQRVTDSLDHLNALKTKHKVALENLQNELRSNPDLNLHVDDWTALSSSEANELTELTKRRDIAYKEIQEQKKVIAAIKAEAAKRKSQAMKAKTVKTGKKNLQKSDTGKLLLDKEDAKLRTLELEHEEEVQKIQESIERGNVNPRLYYKEQGSAAYKLKDSTNRLKFRDTYESRYHIETHAKAYYDTILNQTAEDTINQVMGKVTGNVSENHLKQRTLMVPDKLLYENGFMSKDLMSKVSNYSVYLARRTHIKNVFRDVTLEGGFEPVIEKVNEEFQGRKKLLNDDIKALDEKIAAEQDAGKKSELEKKKEKLDKAFLKLRREFDWSKEKLQDLYSKAMGIKKMSRKDQIAYNVAMSVTSMAALAFTPITMINDLSAMGLQHGIWPFIQSGMYPVLQSIGGLIKTIDSESLRKTAPSIHMALQDVLHGYRDKNFSMFTEPYVNMGKIVGGIEKFSNWANNIHLTTYFDNGLQHIASNISQAELMRITHEYVKEGAISELDSLYLRKHGLDYKKWGERIVNAFEESGGKKNALGGYQSGFWEWQDMEAANEFSRAVFRGTINTTIQRGLADSPFWADTFLGSLLHGFNGWTYAAVNRYVIPSLQEGDARKLLGVLFMLGTGYFVSPLRRLFKGQDMFPENQTPMQRIFETVQDSGYFSFETNMMADINLFTGGTFFRDMKNDRYMDRTRAGLLGPAWGKANQLMDFASAAATMEMNQRDFNNFMHMMPPFNSFYATDASNHISEMLGLAKNRNAAHARKQYQ